MEEQHKPDRRGVIIGALSALGVAAVGIPMLQKEPTLSAPTPTATPTPKPTRNLRLASHDPTSTSVFVNKHNPLQPESYAPTDLRNPNILLDGDPTAENMHLRNVSATALEKMAAASAAAGITLKVVSGYRSYQTQIDVYNQWVASYGQEDADNRSARPGFSEHQTGLAVDVGQADGTDDLNQDFSTTPAGQWLASHCNDYGFIIRFPAGKEAITGYMYEPWHLRYLGVEISKDMKAKGIQTLEEYFKQGAATTYLGA
ncbi:MAG: M15 family metallopeptidase [Micrococcaceae bacterium]